MKKNITVAAVQMEIGLHDVSGNIDKAEMFIQDMCVNQAVDLVVLPEDFVTGPIPHDLDLAMDDSSEPILRLREIAKKYKVIIVAGSFIELHEDRFYNTPLLVGSDGIVYGKYRKSHLWHPEKRYLTPGEGAKVFDTPIGKIGIAICWDLAFPELFLQMARDGAEIICIPSYWTLEDSDTLLRRRPDGGEMDARMVDILCPARAIDSNCLVVYANGAGSAAVRLKTKTIALSQIGHSQICTPLYGVVSKINDNREGYITYTYDRTIARDVEYAYRIRADRREKERVSSESCS